MSLQERTCPEEQRTVGLHIHKAELRCSHINKSIHVEPGGKWHLQGKVTLEVQPRGRRTAEHWSRPPQSCAISASGENTWCVHDRFHRWGQKLTVWEPMGQKASSQVRRGSAGSVSVQGLEATCVWVDLLWVWTHHEVQECYLGLGSHLKLRSIILSIPHHKLSPCSFWQILPWFGWSCWPEQQLCFGIELFWTKPPVTTDFSVSSTFWCLWLVSRCLWCFIS